MLASRIGEKKHWRDQIVKLSEAVERYFASMIMQVRS